MVYGTRLHSHKEFPLRIAEMGLVHRRELSGVRHGLFRVQATQDSTIFVLPNKSSMKLAC